MNYRSTTAQIIGASLREIYLILQTVFIVLRMFGCIDSPWYIIAMPSIVYLGALLLIFVAIGFCEYLSATFAGDIGRKAAQDIMKEKRHHDDK